MTLEKTEVQLIREILRQSAANASNLEEIKEALIGSLKDGGKPGLQDTVRDLGSEVGVARGEIIAHKAANSKDHKIIKRAIAGVGVVAFIALLLHSNTATPIIGSLLKLILKIVA